MSGSRRHAEREHLNEVLSLLAEGGASAVRSQRLNTGHLRVYFTAPSGRAAMIVLSSSSDWRALANMRSQVRRELRR